MTVFVRNKPRKEIMNHPSKRVVLLWAYKAEGRQRLKALPLTSFKPYRPCLSRAAQSGPRTTGQPLKGLPYFLLNGSSY